MYHTVILRSAGTFLILLLSCVPCYNPWPVGKDDHLLSERINTELWDSFLWRLRAQINTASVSPSQFPAGKIQAIENRVGGC